MAKSNGNPFLDMNGRKVHSFALEMSNLGFSRMEEVLQAMLKDGAWRKYKTALGTHEFLQGEFDYFLSQQGVERDHVMTGLRNIEVKAKLEKAMDERRTGHDGYRRSIEVVRKQVPQQPGRPIMPFGVTKSEAKALVSKRGATPPSHRPALGGSVRRYTLTGGKTTKRPSDTKTSLQRATALALKLKDKDLEVLYEALQAERKRRKQRHLRAVSG